MTAPVDSLPTLFFARAAELGFLSHDSVESLVEEAQSTNIAPASLALNRGVLTTEEIDIVHTLLHPRDAIPGYEILGLIGFGGMGVVYRAQQLSLHRPVALKTILLHQFGRSNVNQRFEQEAAAIGRLVHPNIIAAYDFGRHADRFYLAMELVEGTDTQKWAADHRFCDETLAWQLARQVAAGLAHAAAHGVVHRDIKPANILLVAPPAGFQFPLAKITDFGLALLSERDIQQTRLTTMGSVLGSPHYMAPEQLDAADIDHRADIYALGATIFHWFTGQPPWGDSKLSQLVAKKLAGEIPDLQADRPDLSRGSIQLLADMMARDVQARPADYTILLRRIDELLLAIAPAGNKISETVPSTPRTTPTLHNNETEVFRPLKTVPVGSTFLASPQQRMMLAGMLLVAIIFGSLLLLWRPWQDPSIYRDCDSSGEQVALFDGKELTSPYWQTKSGQWQPKIDPEEGNVIVGESTGLLVRHLGADSALATYYRLEIVVKTQSVAEVHFDLPASSSEPSKQYWRLRVQPDHVKLFREFAGAAGDRPTFASPIQKTNNDRHLITLERHTQGWWILLDEQLLTSVPHLRTTPAPEFHLHCPEGPVQFSDLSWQQLVPKIETGS